MMRSIADGMTTIDETFPPIGAEAPSAGEDEAPSGGAAGQPDHVARAESAARSNESRPADQSTEEEHAYQRGKQDRAKGVQRRAVPGEYREAGTSKLALAWTRGWEDGK
jgi:hypothetical protein